MSTFNIENFNKEIKEKFGEDHDICIGHENGNATMLCKKHGEYKMRPDRVKMGRICPLCRKDKVVENFIANASKLHKGKYDYSKVDYETSSKKVCIICPEHGEFWQTPNSHLNGRGCPKCGTIKSADSQKTTQDDFILRATEKHHGKYDYSEVEYVNSGTKVKVICHEKDENGIEHGAFYVNPQHHVHRGDGCPKCSGRDKYKEDGTLLKALEEVYSNEDYTFDKVVYRGYKEKITVTCPEHGDFNISINHALNGQGCPKCRYIKSAENKRRTLEEVIELAKNVHGDKYDYSLIQDYKNDRIRYPIICKRCGNTFYQTIANHIRGGQGCPPCSRERTEEEIRRVTLDFLAKAKELHNDKYDYSKVNYIDSKTKVCIICPDHGEFWQQPNNHLQGQGCPSCSHTFSQEENEVYEFIKEVIGENNVIKNDREILNGKEIDIYVPEYNIGIEFNGLHWHSEQYIDKKYHLEKTEECEKQGIRLIHIFEDEWLNKKEIWKSMFGNMLGRTPNKIYARKCVIREVKSEIGNEFLKNNHLQGVCSSSVKLGLFFNDELVSLMTFGKSRHFIGNGKHEWELLRFCNKLNTNVIGGASKLLKHFIDDYHPKNIVSYADRRWSIGNLYERLGFKLYNKSVPNYFYIKDGVRQNRFIFRKSELIRKYNCPKEMSEHEFCLSQGWYRIYDCGCLCYEWNNDKK